MLKTFHTSILHHSTVCWLQTMRFLKRYLTPLNIIVLHHPQENQTPEIATYENHEALDLPQVLLEDRRPKLNDIISFYSSKLNRWVDARITHDLSKKWDRYYNIQYFNGETDGLFLLPDQRWTFLADSSGPPVSRNNLREESSLPPMHPSPISPPFRIQNSYYQTLTCFDEKLNLSKTESLE